MLARVASKNGWIVGDHESCVDAMLDKRAHRVEMCPSQPPVQVKLAPSVLERPEPAHQ